MFKRSCAFLIFAMAMVALPLLAQQPCLYLPVAIGTDEDRLMTAVNASDDPQAQLAALNKFAQDHPDSKFMPCINEFISTADLKLKDFDKSIEFAEKNLGGNYEDLNLLLTLMRAYASSTKVSDTIFDVINKVPRQAKSETSNPTRPPNTSDAEWAQIQKDSETLGKDSHDYAVWAFFQILPRVTDAAKRLQTLETFCKAYPEAEKDDAAQVNTAYFQAYQMQGKLDKAVESGDKVIAADPNNVGVLNTMGMIYAIYLSPPSPDKATDYAQKALTTAQTLKKPEGVDDAAFKNEQNNQLGIAHMTLGYAALMKAQKTTKFAPILEELENAGNLLQANPALQGQALYYLAFAYERETPANHHGALDALNKAVALPGPFQGQARDLQAKVKAVVK